MTKHVFSNDMVAHVWAQRRQDNGRSSNGNFYFRGDTLYSYGSHFIAARFVSVETEGRADDVVSPVVLMNENRYSVSTARHLSMASRAIPSFVKDVFRVPYPGADSREQHLRNLAHYQAEAEKFAGKAKRARQNKDWYQRQQEAALEAGKRYAFVFQLGDALNALETLDREAKQDRLKRTLNTIISLRTSLKRCNRMRDAARMAYEISSAVTLANNLAASLEVADYEQQEVSRFEQRVIDLDYRYTQGNEHGYILNRSRFAAWEKRIDSIDTIKAAEELVSSLIGRWIAGDSVRSYYDFQFPEDTPLEVRIEARAIWAAKKDALLRINGETVETSKGAEFPVSHAVKAFKLIQACRNARREWKPNGHSVHLGHFTVDKVDALGNVNAGCHYVKWSSIERAAAELGLI